MVPRPPLNWSQKWSQNPQSWNQNEALMPLIYRNEPTPVATKHQCFVWVVRGSMSLLHQLCTTPLLFATLLWQYVSIAHLKLSRRSFRIPDSLRRNLAKRFGKFANANPESTKGTHIESGGYGCLIPLGCDGVSSFWIHKIHHILI